MAYRTMKTTVTLTHPGFFNKSTEMYFSPNQILGYLCSHIVAQSGVQRAVLDLSEMLKEAAEVLTQLIDAHVETGSAKHIVGIVGMPLDKVYDMVIHIVNNTKIVGLNKRNEEVYPEVYKDGGISLNIKPVYQSQEEEGSNFAALDALARNIINSLIYDHQIVHTDSE